MAEICGNSRFFMIIMPRTHKSPWSVLPSWAQVDEWPPATCMNMYHHIMYVLAPKNLSEISQWWSAMGDAAVLQKVGLMTRQLQGITVT